MLKFCSVCENIYASVLLVASCIMDGRRYADLSVGRWMYLRKKKKGKKRRRLYNLITSVASVADRVTRCSHGASITWLNFVTLAAGTRAEEGRSPLGAGRGSPLASRLQHRRDAAGLARNGELGGSRPLPTRGLPKSPRKGRAGKVTGTPGLRCEAEAEWGRKATEI